MKKQNKEKLMANRGTSFKDYLFDCLKHDDAAVCDHIKGALEDPSINDKDDWAYLIKAVNDVASARGKSNFAKSTGISRQSLHKILKGESTPKIENVIAILKACNIQIALKRIHNR